MNILLFFLASSLLVTCAQDTDQTKVAETGEINTLEAEDQCAMLNQVQSVVIQLLSGHFEFSKGLQVLSSASDSLQQDVNTLKGFYTLINSTHREMLHLFSSLVGEEIELGDNMSFPNVSQALQNLKSNLQIESDGAETSSNMARESPGYILELSNTLDQQQAKINHMEKQHKRLLRKYSQVKNSQEVLERQVRNLSAETSLAQHFLTNQKEINGKLLNNIRYLEQNMKKMTQNDSPYLQPLGCPQNFVRNFMSCYLFVNETINWIDAEKVCQSHDPRSHLIGLETKDEEDFIIKFRNYNQAHWSSMYIWTGGNDMGKESDWNWVSSGKPMTYRNWRPNQPDNHNNEWQNCIYLRTDGEDHRWDDWHCHAAKLNFVCEIQLNA